MTMHAPPAPGTAHHPPSAVVWIDGQRASVATMSGEGTVCTCQFDRGALPEAAYLAQVVRLIGNRDRVVIMGPASERLALEREYVGIHHRPERLVDVEPADEVPDAELVDRLRLLAA